MAEEYVSQVLLEINSKKITDFSGVEEGEYELHKPVRLMNGKGHISVAPDYKFSLDYIIPKDTPEFDFDQVKDGRVVIDYQNGKRVTYGGVYTTKVGAAKHDGEKESMKTIEFSAKTRK